MKVETLEVWLQEIEKSPKSSQAALLRAHAIIAARHGITQKDIEEYKRQARPHKNFKTFAEHSIPQKEKEGDENE